MDDLMTGCDNVSDAPASATPFRFSPSIAHYQHSPLARLPHSTTDKELEILHRFSSYFRIQRVRAIVFRFRFNCRHTKLDHSLTMITMFSGAKTNNEDSLRTRKLATCIYKLRIIGKVDVNHTDLQQLTFAIY